MRDTVLWSKRLAVAGALVAVVVAAIWMGLTSPVETPEIYAGPGQAPNADGPRPDAPDQAPRGDRPPGAGPEAGSATAMPIRDVVLFSSGVGYFERGGKVVGNSTAELKFKVSDINDLLKSLVVQDLNGGRITTVTYGSRDPLNKTLRSFAIDLTGNPTFGGLLNQVRGETVEVTSSTSRLTGVIIGVEKKLHVHKDGVTTEHEILNLHTPEGLRGLPMDQIQRVKLTNAELDAELRQALSVLAAGHDTQKKTVGFTFTGQGERQVRVGYITENPIWKTTYRLIADDAGKLTLQGWAIVENTGDDDWSGVQLTLVSGRPISFIQDLYQPLYVPRPVVQPELYASLRPQTYDSGIEGEAGANVIALGNALRDSDGGNVDRLSRNRKMAPTAPAVPSPPSAAFGGRGAAPAGEAELATEKADAARFRMLEAAQSAVSQATGGKLGDLFRYSVQTPVTLPRRKSAMIPIINGPVGGEKISIYNANVQVKHPLLGLRLKNTTGLHLSPGPITVYADGAYGGDARIEDVRADETRLISYGIDLAVAVESVAKPGKSEQLSVALRRGVLTVKRQYEEIREYTLRNTDDKPHKVLVEHPYRAEWKLLEPATFEDRTTEVYRFAVTVPARQSAKLVVREQRAGDETISVGNQNVESIQYYIRSGAFSPAVREALERLVVLKNQQTLLARAVGDIERKISEITDEQGRIRQNMSGLPANSELYARYVKKLDDQETAIETLRSQLGEARERAEVARTALERFLLELDVK